MRFTYLLSILISTSAFTMTPEDFVDDNPDLNKILEEIRRKKAREVKSPKSDDLVFYDFKKQQQNKRRIIAKEKSVPKLERVTARPLSRMAKSLETIADPRNIVWPETIRASFEGLEETSRPSAILSAITDVKLYHEDIQYYEVGQNLSLKILEEGIVPTLFQSSFERHDVPLPLLTLEFEEDLLQELKLERKVSAGHLLMALPSSYEAVDLDHYFDHVVYLDSKGVITEFKDEYSYALFLNVDIGNILVDLKIGSELFSKLVSIQEGHLTYSSPIPSPLKEYRFGLNELMPFAKRPSKVKVSPRDIKTFISRTKVSIDGRGIKLSKVSKLENSPLYVNFSLDRDLDIILPLRSSNTIITVPSPRRFEQLMDYLEIDDLDDVCVVNLKLGKRKIQNYISRTSNDYLDGHEVFYLDSDGDYGSVHTEKTTDIFIITDQSTLIMSEISFSDGRKTHHQNFCSPGMFIQDRLQI